jgi:hypothetical protein
MSPAGYANRLLAKFGNAPTDPQARPDSEAVAETREFCRWVDDRLKTNRQAILREATDPDVVDFARPVNPFEQNEDVPQATTLHEYLREMGWDRPHPASTSTDSRYDPMWDQFLDGP